MEQQHVLEISASYTGCPIALSTKNPWAFPVQDVLTGWMPFLRIWWVYENPLAKFWKNYSESCGAIPVS